MPKPKQLTCDEVASKIHAEAVSKRGKVYTAYWGFFYTHGCTANKKADKIKEVFGADKVNILDTHEQWKAFRGGDTVQKGSHWRVKFEFIELRGS